MKGGVPACVPACLPVYPQDRLSSLVSGNWLHFYRINWFVSFRYDSPPWSIPKPRPGQPPFRFWLMKSTSPKTPGMDAQQFKRLIDQWGDDSGVTAEEPITEWIGYLRPNASRQQQLSDVIKIYEWSDLHPQHQICYT